MKIDDCVAVIIGIGRGIGFATCHALLERRAKVCFGDISLQVGEDAETEFHEKYGEGNSMFVKCDVTKEEDIKNMFDVAEARFGPVNVVFNNAGILGQSAWQKAVDINIGGTIRSTEVALSRMGKDRGGKGGVIITAGSCSGLFPEFWSPVYAATKSAIVMYTRSWAMEKNFVKHGIRFNTVCPGTVDTPFVNTVTPDNVLNYEALVQDVGGPRIRPEEVANAVIHLIEDDKCNGVAMDITPGKQEPFQFPKPRRT